MSIKKYLKNWKGLSSNELAVIQDQTNLNPDTIREAHKTFMKEYPKGKVPNEALKCHFEGTDNEFYDVMIKVMDADSNGFIDFKEMIVFTSMMESITNKVEPDDKSLSWLFRAFDFDKSGTICHNEFKKLADFLSMVKREHDEMSEIVAGCGVLGIIWQSIAGCIRIVNARVLFMKMDTNNDNVLDEPEFIAGMKAFFKTLHN